ncbi:ABC transporter permease [Actinocorallia lasiicapitis]
MTKVTLRNLAAHKLRLVLTALSVILGVAFVAGTLTFTDTVTKSFDDLLGSFGKNTDAVVRAKPVAGDAQTDDEAAATGIPIPQSVVDTLGKADGVAAVYPGVQGYAAVIDKDNKLVGGGGPPQLGLNWLDDGDRTIATGQAPQGPDQVALDETTAEKTGYKVGDTIKVQLRGSIIPVKVVALIGGSNLGATLTYFDTPTAQKLLMKPGEYSSVSLKAAPGLSEQQLVDKVTPVLPGQFEAVTGEKVRDESKSDIDAVLSFLRWFLLAFAVVSIIVGSFNIFNTFSMLVAQRTKELALLRAVGASRSQVTNAVLGEAIAVGVVGSTLGLGLGVGLAVLLKSFFSSQGLELGGGLNVTVMTVFWSYLVGILVTCVAAYFPARRAAKTPPVAAMRDDVGIPQRSLQVRTIIGSVIALGGVVLMAIALSGAISGAAPTLITIGVGALLTWLAAGILAAVIAKPVVRVLASYYPKLFGVAGRMARENPGRNPRRTAVTAVALMIGLSLVTMVNVLSASVKASLNDVVDQQFGADYVVAVDGPGGIDPNLSAAIAKLDGVEKSVPVGGDEFVYKGKKTGYASGDSAGMLEATNSKVLNGTAALSPNGIMLSEDDAKDKGLTVGSTMDVKFLDGKTETLKVEGIYTNSDFVGPRVLSEAAWKAHVDKPLPFLLALKTAKTDDAFRQSLDAAAKAYPGVEVQDQADLKKEVAGELDGIVAFFTMMLALSIIIAVFGVVNTIVLSVTERTRELGLLRAVGMSRRQMRRMVRLESVAIALFGGLLGIALGLGFGTAIQTAAGDDMKVLAIPYGSIVLWIVFSAIIGILASLWPAWRAGRMDVLKAIATQ